MPVWNYFVNSFYSGWTGEEGVMEGDGQEKHKRWRWKRGRERTEQEREADEMARSRRGGGRTSNRRGGEGCEIWQYKVPPSPLPPYPPPTSKGNYSRELACVRLRNRILIVSSATFCLIKSKLFLGNVLM
jgi:hypothetical protein